MNKKNPTENEPVEIKDDIRDIRNDIEQIKSDTHNINRIMTIANPAPIIKDLQKIIGDSELKTAVLYLTKNESSTSDLVKELKINPKNLTKFVKGFVDRGYVSALKRGREKSFIRSEILDQLHFEELGEFSSKIESWKYKQNVTTQELTEKNNTTA